MALALAAQVLLGDRPRPRTLDARQKASSIVSVTFGTPGRFKDMPGYGWIARYNLAAGRILSVDLDLIATDNQHIKFQPELVGAKEAKRAWAELSIGFNAEPTWHGSTARITLSPPR